MAKHMGAQVDLGWRGRLALKAQAQRNGWVVGQL